MKNKIDISNKDLKKKKKNILKELFKNKTEQKEREQKEREQKEKEQREREHNKEIINKKKKKK